MSLETTPAIEFELEVSYMLWLLTAVIAGWSSMRVAKRKSNEASPYSDVSEEERKKFEQI